MRGVRAGGARGLKRRCPAFAVVLSLAAVAAAACGGPTPVSYGTPTPIATSSLAALSAPDLLARARTAVLGAGGAHLVADTADGPPADALPPGAVGPTPLAAASPSPSGDSGSISFDVRVNTSGTGSGTVTWSGQTLRMVSADGHVYVQADSAFWDAAGSAGDGAAVDGRWVEASSGNALLNQFAMFLDLPDLLTQLVTSDDSGGPSVLGYQTRDNRPVVAVQIPDTGGNATVYVAADGGPPYIVEVDESLGTAWVDIVFSDLAPQPPVPAPARSDVVPDTTVPGLTDEAAAGGPVPDRASAAS